MKNKIILLAFFSCISISVFGFDHVDPSEYMDPDDKDGSFLIWPLLAIGGIIYVIIGLFRSFKELSKSTSDFEKLIVVACAISILFLSIGFFKVPYGYFVFLRFLISLTSVFCLIYESSRKINHHWKVYFLVILILHNPILPIHLYYKSIWLIIDFLFGMIFFSKITDLIDEVENRRPNNNNSPINSINNDATSIKESGVHGTESILDNIFSAFVQLNTLNISKEEYENNWCIVCENENQTIGEGIKITNCFQIFERITGAPYFYKEYTKQDLNSISYLYLENLDLPKIPDLSRLINLRHIEINNANQPDTNLGFANLDFIKNNVNLNCIKLSNCGNFPIDSISNLSNLKRLSILECVIPSLLPLQRLINLTELSLSHTIINPNDILQIKRTNPFLKIKQ